MWPIARGDDQAESSPIESPDHPAMIPEEQVRLQSGPDSDEETGFEILLRLSACWIR